MEQSELNRFNLNKNESKSVAQINDELNNKNNMPQTEENEEQPKQKTILENSEPVLYIKRKNKQKEPTKDLISEKYGKPITNDIQVNVLPQNPYVINQVTPDKYSNIKFGYIETPIVCPFCQQNTITRIEESFSCSTFFMYILIFLLIVVPIFIICSMDDRNHNYDDNCCRCYSCPVCFTDCKCCIDVDHYCSNCGKKIGSKNTFAELCPCCQCNH